MKRENDIPKGLGPTSPWLGGKGGGGGDVYRLSNWHEVIWGERQHRVDSDDSLFLLFGVGGRSPGGGESSPSRRSQSQPIMIHPAPAAPLQPLPGEPVTTAGDGNGKGLGGASSLSSVGHALQAIKTTALGTGSGQAKHGGGGSQEENEGEGGKRVQLMDAPARAAMSEFHPACSAAFLSQDRRTGLRCGPSSFLVPCPCSWKGANARLVSLGGGKAVLRDVGMGGASQAVLLAARRSEGRGDSRSLGDVGQTRETKNKKAKGAQGRACVTGRGFLTEDRFSPIPLAVAQRSRQGALKENGGRSLVALLLLVTRADLGRYQKLEGMGAFARGPFLLGARDLRSAVKTPRQNHWHSPRPGGHVRAQGGLVLWAGCRDVGEGRARMDRSPLDFQILSSVSPFLSRLSVEEY